MLLSKFIMRDSKSKFIKQKKKNSRFRIKSKLRIKYQSKDLHNDNFYHKYLLKLWHVLIWNVNSNTNFLNTIEFLIN